MAVNATGEGRVPAAAGRRSAVVPRWAARY